MFARQSLFTGVQLASYDQAKGFAVRISKIPEMGIRPLSNDSPLAHVFAATLSGAVSTIATAPIEMVKTTMQLASRNATKKKTSFIQTFPLVYAEFGLRGFWRGSGALFIRLAPQTTLVLVGSEYFRKLFEVKVGG
jgi:hypothetical protein